MAQEWESFNLIADILGLPEQGRTKEFDRLKKRIGKTGEGWAREDFASLGFKVMPRSQVKGKGGYDFLLQKIDSYDLSSSPDTIYVEVKVNTSKLTKHQKTVMAEIVEHGGNVVLKRYRIPLYLADWL
jgi:hypothetical protein